MGFILFLWTQLQCTEPRIYFGVGLSTAASTQTLLCQQLQHPAAAPVLSVPPADPRFDAPQTQDFYKAPQAIRKGAFKTAGERGIVKGTCLNSWGVHRGQLSLCLHPSTVKEL